MREIKNSTSVPPSIKSFDQYLSTEELESKDDAVQQPGPLDRRSIRCIFSDLEQLLKDLQKVNKGLLPATFVTGQLPPFSSDLVEGVRAEISEIQNKLNTWSRYPQFVIEDTRSPGESEEAQKFLRMEKAQEIVRNATDFLGKALIYREEIEEVASGICSLSKQI